MLTLTTGLTCPSTVAPVVVASPAAVIKYSICPMFALATSLSMSRPLLTSGPVGRTVVSIGGPSPLVSVCTAPSGSRPAPTVSSLSEVRTTGCCGIPTICSVPPMRSLMSNRASAGSEAGVGALELDHQALARPGSAAAGRRRCGDWAPPLRPTGRGRCRYRPRCSAVVSTAPRTTMPLVLLSASRLPRTSGPWLA